MQHLMTTTEELAWMAGIVDGEGCIGIYSATVGRGYSYPRLQVGVTNTDMRILRPFQQRFGGCVSTKGMKARRRACWQWQISHPHSVEFLRAIRPFLASKGEEADLALEFAATLNSLNSKPVTPEVTEQRWLMVARMKVLKAREVA